MMVKKIQSISLVLFLIFLPDICRSQIVKALSAPVNDPKAFNGYPSLSADGKELIFISNRDGDGQMKIYYSRYISTDRWNPPRQLLPELYVKAHVGGAFLSFDGTTLYFHSNLQDNTVGIEDIFLSRKEGDSWSKAENIGEPVNSSDFEGYPSLSSDGQRLYFVRFKKGRSNCPVIMMAVKGRDGQWLSPIELPAPINKYCESSPSILADGKTLLFSSNRPGGKGGFDLYMSRWGEEGQWSEPINLSYLNSEGNELSAAYSAEENLLVYHSDDKIMQAFLPVGQAILMDNFCLIKGYTKDALAFKPVATKISVQSLSGKAKPVNFSNDSIDGSYSTLLKPGDKYVMEVKAEGYLSDKYELNLEGVAENQLLEINFNLLPEKTDLHYYFVDSLTHRVIKPDITLYSVKDQTAIPVSFNARNEVFEASIKLKHKYQVEISLEGYGTYSDLIYLEEAESYHPVRFEKALRKKYYPIAIKAVDAASSKTIPDAELTITDLDTQMRMFPLYDAAKGHYIVDMREQGKYKLNMRAEGYKAQEEIIDSFQLIQERRFKKEMALETF